MPDASQLQAVQREWLRRVEAEFRSATITQHLTLWLMQMAAPFELLRMGLRTVDDELVHSELSHQVYESAGGREVANLSARRLGLTPPPGEVLGRSVARTCVETFCLGETVAVRLFGKLREGCDEPAARVALDRILTDEVRHREFGWTALEWLLSSPHESVTRELISTELARMFAEQRKAYAFASLNQGGARTTLQRRWGLMPPCMYARSLLDALERDYVPRFADFDIDARAAWDDR